MDNSDITNFLSSGVKAKGNHPLDRFVNRTITKIIDQFIVPWLANCLAKYTNEDFHNRMLDPSFDFILDWKLHHPKKYGAFLRTSRKFRNRFDFEVEDVLQKVVLLLTNNNWVIYDWEMDRLRDVIQSVKNEIYMDIDESFV